MYVAIESIEAFARRDARNNQPSFFRKLNECVANKREKEKFNLWSKQLEDIAFQGKFNGSSSLLQAIRSKGYGCYRRWRKRFVKEVKQDFLEVVFRVRMTDACHSYLQVRLMECLVDCSNKSTPIKMMGYGYTPATSCSGK